MINATLKNGLSNADGLKILHDAVNKPVEEGKLDGADMIPLLTQLLYAQLSHQGATEADATKYSQEAISLVYAAMSGTTPAKVN